MANFVIVTDSGSDLSAEMIEELGIKVLQIGRAHV